ncbi:MAG: hypothetical protein Q9163_005411 [Psora crenata]
MSAPKAGRQSPEPEKQTEEQVAAPESGQIGAAPSETHAKDASEDSKANTLSSNPEGPLEGAAHEKVNDLVLYCDNSAMQKEDMKVELKRLR